MDNIIWQQAAKWVEQLDQIDENNTEFTAWLNANENHRRAFLSLKSHYESEELRLCLAQVRSATTPAYNADTQVRSTINFGQWFRLPMYSSVAFASVLIIALSALVFLPKTSDTLEENKSQYEVATQTGKRKTIQLADGSAVALNAKTRLRIDHSATKRQSTLLEGEAFFDVARDENRPFVIDTGSAEIKVLGTAFNVDKQNDNIKIAVREGRVQVSTESDAVYLTSGQVVTVSGLSISAPATTTATLIGKHWQSGWIEAESEPLSNIVGKLQRYSEKPIAIAPSLAQEHLISGRFSLEQPVQTLELIASLHQLSLVHHTSKIEVTKK